jgi:hypothetical protein
MGGITLPSAKFISIRASNLGIAANQDLAGSTVPVGKRWYVSECSFYNQGVGSITAFMQFKSGGNYYRLTNTTTAIGTLSQFIPLPLGFLLEAGESLAVTTQTTAGLNVLVGVVEFDASAPIKRGAVLGTATGANLLYTCPANKTAILLASGIPFAFSGSGSGNLAACSDAVTQRTYKTFVVPNGQVVGPNYQVGSFSSNADTRTAGSVTAVLEANDFVSVDVSAAGAATAWIAGAFLET